MTAPARYRATPPRSPRWTRLADEAVALRALARTRLAPQLLDELDERVLVWRSRHVPASPVAPGRPRLLSTDGSAARCQSA